jgi:hypothetical protein
MNNKKNTLKIILALIFSLVLLPVSKIYATGELSVGTTTAVIETQQAPSDSFLSNVVYYVTNSNKKPSTEKNKKNTKLSFQQTANKLKKNNTNFPI